jgi:hypothetical protein
MPKDAYELRKSGEVRGVIADGHGAGERGGGHVMS